MPALFAGESVVGESAGEVAGRSGQLVSRVGRVASAGAAALCRVSRSAFRGYGLTDFVTGRRRDLSAARRRDGWAATASTSYRISGAAALVCGWEAVRDERVFGAAFLAPARRRPRDCLHRRDGEVCVGEDYGAVGGAAGGAARDGFIRDRGPRAAGLRPHRARWEGSRL